MQNAVYMNMFETIFRFVFHIFRNVLKILIASENHSLEVLNIFKKGDSLRGKKKLKLNCGL